MQYGEAKWIIHPLGVKVRLMKPEDWKEIQIHSNYAVDDTDYAGVEHLKLILDDLQYYDDGKDLAPYQLEPLTLTGNPNIWIIAGISSVILQITRNGSVR